MNQIKDENKKRIAHFNFFFDCTMLANMSKISMTFKLQKE